MRLFKDTYLSIKIQSLKISRMIMGKGYNERLLRFILFFFQFQDLKLRNSLSSRMEEIQALYGFIIKFIIQ